MAKVAREDDPLKGHSILQKIRESGQFGNVAIITGYIGKSDNSDIVRIYPSIRLDRYIDIPRKILFTQK